jgi:RNA recognition motif-containing protein
LEAKIITVRPHYRKRSAGYGFVTFATLEETTKAANDLNKKELDGREINVEVARPKPVVVKAPEQEQQEQQQEQQRATKPKQKKRRARKNVSRERDLG